MKDNVLNLIRGLTQKYKYFCVWSHKGAGFTLIELIITLGVMVLLTSILIIYSRTGEQRIILFKEQARVINAVMRAKSLAIQTFAEGGAACGYGIHFGYGPEGKFDRFIIFKDLPPIGEENCISVAVGVETYTGDKQYTATNPNELYQENVLDKKLGFEGDLRNIVFIPPDPKVILNAASEQSAGTIQIKILGDPTTLSIIKVTNVGQITTQ